MRVNCDNCGVSFCKPAKYVKLYNNHFCCKECYFEYRKKNSLFTNTGKKYDISQQNILKNLAKERTKRTFKPDSYWNFID